MLVKMKDNLISVRQFGKIWLLEGEVSDYIWIGTQSGQMWLSGKWLVCFFIADNLNIFF